jgi:hypothetical protein
MSGKIYASAEQPVGKMLSVGIKLKIWRASESI